MDVSWPFKKRELGDKIGEKEYHDINGAAP